MFVVIIVVNVLFEIDKSELEPYPFCGVSFSIRVQPGHISVPHMDWACNVSGLSPDGRNYLSKNTAFVLLHMLDLFLVTLDESPAYRIEDVTEVELSAVDADDVQGPFDVRVQDNGNPILVGIVVIELRVSDHHIPLTRTSLDDRLRIYLLTSPFLGLLFTLIVWILWKCYMRIEEKMLFLRRISKLLLTLAHNN